MARTIRAQIFNGGFAGERASTIGFTCPAGKKWIIAKLTTRIVTPGSATNFVVKLYRNGFQTFTVFDKGSAPAQTDAEDIAEARGIILAEGDTIRFVAGFPPGAPSGVAMEAVLDHEEVDE